MKIKKGNESNYIFEYEGTLRYQCLSYRELTVFLSKNIHSDLLPW